MTEASNDNHSTIAILLAQYGQRVVIPVEQVCRDYFSHLDPAKFVRKVNEGAIAIPMMRVEASQKSAKGIHVADLAEWLDARREAARKECRQLAA
ncbi:pyocin activator PrtN family protein [Pelagibacterium flavum]|uniref:Pyocin activator PrtN family protein n=1 Tax=Pelagibacterium flavum TaxID=2984530 RepID=A0ABY6IKZ3_9HYPH|nr:pyocin activator PrtN family protein [Pelagibacterium sp. YIM 151497]UYQ71263.1 pyocin activator PrtN family protein [Pelagibacterium sp. YIM 151497]